VLSAKIKNTLDIIQEQFLSSIKKIKKIIFFQKKTHRIEKNYPKSMDFLITKKV
jgi:hypothetical protein